MLLLVRTDIVLERRAPQLALAMALFAAVAQVVLHYGTDIPEPPVAVTVGSSGSRSCWPRCSRSRGSSTPSATRACSTRSCSPDPAHGDLGREGACHRGPAGAHGGRGRPLTYLFLPVDAPVPALGTLVLALIAGDIGLAALGALVAAVASAVRGREVMVPLLYLPAAVPLLIAALACSVHAADGESIVRPLALVLLYDAIVGLLAYAVASTP